MKTLSFIIPLYNSSRWVEKCLYSVLGQDIPEEEMEIICVNDGSPDRSADMAREIGREHPSVIVIDQPNQGPSGARNTGMRQATGKYLCFVDPDDFMEPDVCRALVRRMEDDNLDMLRFNYQGVDEDYHPIDKPAFERRFDYSPKRMSGAEFLATRLDISCNIWRYIYRREIITTNGIWCFTGDYFDDTPWLPLVLLKAERMDVCDTVVYNYMERCGSLVKARNPEMLRRKADGQLLLLKYLERELSDIRSGVLAVNAEWKDGVTAWYERMEAHSVISMVTDVGVSLYEDRKMYFRQLKELDVLPIRSRSLKGRLINLSPFIAAAFIHYKNL